MTAEDTPYAHWPRHGSERACGEGDCRRCELEQARDEPLMEDGTWDARAATPSAPTPSDSSSSPTGCSVSTPATPSTPAATRWPSPSLLATSPVTTGKE